MDMWEPYIRATRDGVPDGDQRIVFDRFHIMREMTRAVDTVRKQEHRGFLRAGEDSPLTGTKYLWLFSDERRPHHYAESFATLQALNLKPVASATLRTSRPRSTCTVVDLYPR
jgi:transposase